MAFGIEWCGEPIMKYQLFLLVFPTWRALYRVWIPLKRTPMELGKQNRWLRYTKPIIQNIQNQDIPSMFDWAASWFKKYYLSKIVSPLKKPSVQCIRHFQLRHVANLCDYAEPSRVWRGFPVLFREPLLEAFAVSVESLLATGCGSGKHKRCPVFKPQADIVDEKLERLFAIIPGPDIRRSAEEIADENNAWTIWRPTLQRWTLLSGSNVPW